MEIQENGAGMESNPQDEDVSPQPDDSKSTVFVVTGLSLEKIPDDEIPDEAFDTDHITGPLSVPCQGRTPVDGKYPSKPQAMAEYNPETHIMSIRVDDPNNPSFWLNIQVPLSKFNL